MCCLVSKLLVMSVAFWIDGDARFLIYACDFVKNIIYSGLNYLLESESQEVEAKYDACGT